MVKAMERLGSGQADNSRLRLSEPKIPGAEGKGIREMIKVHGPGLEMAKKC